MGRRRMGFRESSGETPNHPTEYEKATAAAWCTATCSPDVFRGDIFLEVAIGHLAP